jgi:DNA-binding CsgD family transcriptional regulator
MENFARKKLADDDPAVHGSPNCVHALGVHGAELLTDVGMGIIVVTRGCRVVFMNSLARGLCASDRGISVNAGSLVSSDSAVNATLNCHIRACTDGAEQERSRLPGKAIKVQRSGSAPLMLLVSRYESSPLPDSQSPDGSMAKLMIADPLKKRKMHELHLTEWFGLTRAEAELACALVNGERLESFSAKKGVKISTLRTQLSSILSKTGVERQTDLISLLTRLPTADGTKLLIMP